MKKIYFVSYAHKSGFGNYDSTITWNDGKEILGDLKTLFTEYVEENYGVQNVIILNWIDITPKPALKFPFTLDFISYEDGVPAIDFSNGNFGIDIINEKERTGLDFIDGRGESQKSFLKIFTKRNTGFHGLRARIQDCIDLIWGDSRNKVQSPSKFIEKADGLIKTKYGMSDQRGEQRTWQMFKKDLEEYFL